MTRLRELQARLEAHAPGELAHGERVASYSVGIAERLGLLDEELRQIRIAAALHDVGKLLLPAEVLSQPGPLDGDQVLMIRTHPEKGAEVWGQAGAIAEAIAAHHERYDGAGYPAGRKGEEIPLMARIIAVAEVFDTLSTDRNYRRALSEEEALAEIRRNAGRQLDARVVATFLEVQPLIQPILG